MSRAFIFTMDAVLALIPVFIILAGVSQLSSSEILLLQGHVLGSERIAQDVLQVMSAKGDIESLNQSRLNQILRMLVPSYLNYSYEVENVNGSILFTITNGTLAGRDIMVARRLGLVEIEKIEGELDEIARVPVSEKACCIFPGNKPAYYMRFNVTEEDLDAYDFWLVGERHVNDSANADAWVYDQEDVDDEGGGADPCCWLKQGERDYDIFPIPGPVQLCSCPSTADECKETTAEFQIHKIRIDGKLEEDTTNYVFIELYGVPSIQTTYYLIRVPANTCNALVTSQSAKLKEFVWVTLKVCSK